MQSQTERLPVHEWMAVVAIIAIFFFLTSLSLSNYERQYVETDAVAVSEPLVDITILGAVKYPGTYQIERGTTLQEALEHAEPLPTANLKPLNLESKIVKKRKITVKEDKKRK